MSVMSRLSLTRQEERCGNCGQTEEKSGIPTTTIAIDRSASLLCDECVASFDWSDWIFDPVLNVYLRK
jgi:hypothetical protein